MEVASIEREKAMRLPRLPRMFTIGKVLSRPALLVVNGWFIAGATLLIGSLVPGLDVNPAITNQISEGVLGVLLMLGSALVALSALGWQRESTSWRLELTGFPILISAWLLYLTLIVLTSWTALFPLGLGLGFVSACIQRWFEVKRHVARTRQNVRALEELEKHVRDHPEENRDA